MPVSLPPTGLPVEASLPELREALAGAGHAVLHAPPGAGKTTVVPLRLLDEPWLGDRTIVVLEPRRLAARAAARRMAFLLGEKVGGTVGYRTRDERHVGADTRVEVVTEGILTRRLQRDRSLSGVGLVVFDELHERNLHAELALALLLDARRSFWPLNPALQGGFQGPERGLRSDVRVLAMSATLETARVAALLAGDGHPAPTVAAVGRAHPVDIRWIPMRSGDRLAEPVAAAVRRALRDEPGDVLVFLPGAADIRRVEGLLAGGLPDAVDIRPLYGALPVVAQDAALAPSPPGRRRVVLATDIAETSLTVAGVRVVVDSGQARSPRYDPRSGLTRLVTGPISRASAEQRAGRAGRTEPGVAYRLWSKLEHGTRRPFPDAEIATVDLAGLALELAVWGAEPETLAFSDPPPKRALEEARALLRQLGALDENGLPTPAGKAMAELPLHPRLARMVTGALRLGLGWPACVLAALLEERDVLRGRPDELPVDVAERVRLIADPGARHPSQDGGAVRAARRRAEELARRVGGVDGSPVGGVDGSPVGGDRAGATRAPLDTSRLGAVLALAYPDRVAQGRGGARFRLRNGAGAWVPSGDPLAGESWLVVAELDAARRDSRIRMAAALDPADLDAVFGDDVERVVTLAWDAKRDDLRARVERRLGGLVLSSVEGPAEPGPDTTRALLARVRGSRLRALPWTEEARALQHRVAFVARTFGGTHWPDLSDAALVASLDQWLAPLLAGATGRADLEAIDVGRALRALLAAEAGHRSGVQIAGSTAGSAHQNREGELDRLAPPRSAHQNRQGELDRLAPPALTLASGRRVAVDYASGKPTVAVRVQEVFGMTSHPTVADGRVPVLFQLLSPAGRPVQITSDLPSFWAGSWASVRKEMAGRYPKHDWPEDPTAPRR